MSTRDEIAERFRNMWLTGTPVADPKRVGALLMEMIEKNHLTAETFRPTSEGWPIGVALSWGTDVEDCWMVVLMNVGDGTLQVVYTLAQFQQEVQRIALALAKLRGDAAPTPNGFLSLLEDMMLRTMPGLVLGFAMGVTKSTFTEEEPFVISVATCTARLPAAHSHADCPPSLN